MTSCEVLPSLLEERLGYTFTNRSLLETALTHTSFVKGGGKSKPHNERMEFLGDAVLELCVSEYLYARYPALQEGALTRLRARLVCENALYRAAKALELPRFLHLGNGEEQTGGRGKPSIVSDALEAVLGGVFLDGGMEAAKRVVIEKVISLLEEAHADAIDRDYKTRLQEHTQKEHMGQPEYVLLAESGPEHQKTFTVSVRLNGQTFGSGTGATKQSAGQQAARASLILLGAEADA